MIVAMASTRLEHTAQLRSAELRIEEAGRVARGYLVLDLDGGRDGGQWTLMCSRQDVERIISECGESLKGSRWRLTLQRIA